MNGDDVRLDLSDYPREQDPIKDLVENIDMNRHVSGDIMNGLKCSVSVVAGIIPGTAIPKYTRQWDFTQEDLDSPPRYIDLTGAALNYAMSLQNPAKVNWVKFEWIWC